MRVVLLCNRHLSEFDCAVINLILASEKIHVVGALVNSASRRSLFDRLKREIRKGRGGFVIVQAVRTLLRKLGGPPTKRIQDVLDESQILLTPSLYREEVYQWVKDRRADCFLLRGFGIIREPILSFCRYGVISYHHGDLLKYRGGPPAFWELYNNEKQIGVTIQVLDKGIDTGSIVVQRFFSLKGTETWSALRKRIYEGSTDLAREALHRLSAGGPLSQPVGEVGKLYTLPNLRQWITLQFKIAGRNLLK